MVNVNIPTPIMLNHNFLVIVILFSLPLLKTSLKRAVLDSFETSPYPLLTTAASWTRGRS